MKTIHLSKLDIGNIRKTDWLMSAENDFPLRSEPPRLRYLLCSTPRSGSTLVGDILYGTGAAGNPQEYLNSRLMAAWLRQKGKLDGIISLDEYLHDLECRRTTSNGVFGIKVHFEHLMLIWKEDYAGMKEFLNRFDRIVLLTRRDKISQAASWYKALVTQIWTSEDKKFMDADDPRLTEKPPYRPDIIAKKLADIMVHEAKWRVMLAGRRQPCQQIVHEDFLTDMQGNARSLFSALGLGENVKWTEPQIRRQRHDNEPLLEAFRRELGLASEQGSEPQA